MALFVRQVAAGMRNALISRIYKLPLSAKYYLQVSISMPFNQRELAMNYFYITLLIVLPFSSQAQNKVIVECYARYNQALELKNPVLAYSQSSIKAKKYLDSCIYNAGVGDTISLCRQKPIDRFFILVTRQLLKNSNIDFRKSKSAELFNILVDNELINPLSSSTVTEIKVYGYKASAKLKIGNITYPFIVHFYKEPNGWKFDFSSLYAIEGEKVKRMAELSNTDINQLIAGRVAAKTSMLLIPAKSLNGKKIYRENKNIWIPLSSLID